MGTLARFLGCTLEYLAKAKVNIIMLFFNLTTARTPPSPIGHNYLWISVRGFGFLHSQSAMVEKIEKVSFYLVGNSPNQNWKAFDIFPFRSVTLVPKKRGEDDDREIGSTPAPVVKSYTRRLGSVSVAIHHHSLCRDVSGDWNGNQLCSLQMSLGTEIENRISVSSSEKYWRARMTVMHIRVRFYCIYGFSVLTYGIGGVGQRKK